MRIGWSSIRAAVAVILRFLKNSQFVSPELHNLGECLDDLSCMCLGVT